MKLKEFIKDMEDGEMIYLGASSSYICIEPKEELIDSLEQWDRIHRERISKTLNGYKKSLNNIVTGKAISNSCATIENYLSKILQIILEDTTGLKEEEIKKQEFKRAKYENTVQNSFKRLEKIPERVVFYKHSIDRLQDHLDNWIPFLDREVTDSYRLPISNAGMAIRITGVENGDFWDLDEYKKWKESGELPIEEDCDEEE